MIKVLNVVGARPNFMKIAPIQRAMQKANSTFDAKIIHTGQHYDERMSKLFFDDLRLPKPDVFLGIGSASHAIQTAKIMVEFEKVCFEQRPDLVIVVGDVNSTVACSMVASKLWIPIVHVEAGLRSFDRKMPEEINRMVTDAISDLLFVTEKSGMENLQKEGVANDKIHMVGNVMIDSLVHFLNKARESDILQRLNLKKDGYVLTTLHRPSNVDDADNFAKILDAFEKIEKEIKIIFPIHPRTEKNIKNLGLDVKVKSMKNLVLLPPTGYLNFLNLQANCKFVISDSGGIQEETTYLGIPCLTVRENTERPITNEIGTNEIVGRDTQKIIESSQLIMASKWKKGQIPPYWDGHTAERIIKILANH